MRVRELVGGNVIWVEPDNTLRRATDEMVSTRVVLLRAITDPSE